MRIRQKELLRLRVRTRSGMYLGVVADTVIETDTQSILQYEVRIDWRRTKILPFFKKQRLLVHRDQVADITEKELIVDDLVVPQGAREREDSYRVADPAPL